MSLSRDAPLIPEQSASLFADVQNYAAHRKGGEFLDISEDAFQKNHGWFLSQFATRVLPNM
jgi:ureidoacrylate peracid hydrolase